MQGSDDASSTPCWFYGMVLWYFSDIDFVRIQSYHLGKHRTSAVTRTGCREDFAAHQYSLESVSISVALSVLLPPPLC